MVELDLDLGAYVPRPTFHPSPQQASVMDWVKHGTGNAVIQAVAGSGKTTTLVEALSYMRGSVAFAAYNKRIADEINEKVGTRGLQNVKVGTFHSFGFQAWRNAYRGTQVDGNKIRNIVKELVVKEKQDDGSERETRIPDQLHTFVEKIVSLVRQEGIGFLTRINDNDAWEALIAHHALEDEVVDRKPWDNKDDYDEDEIRFLVDEGKKWALRVLRHSIATAGETIDFDDMLYMPLLANVAIPKYDWVLIDEAQDSNATRRSLAKAMLKPGGRLIAVGDEHQAIYGFTGADSDSIKNIIDEFGCIELPLTVSYRCPRQVVKLATKWVSHIQSTDDAPEGMVLDIPQSDLNTFLMNRENNLNQSAVLCRKNAPLVDLAFKLIRAHVPCHVEGRDIGASIKSMVTRWKKVQTLDALKRKVDDYSQREIQKRLARGQEQVADSIADKCTTLNALIDGLQTQDQYATIRDLLSLCDTMFADQKRTGLTLSSIHRSKGREWKTVYWLGRNQYQPSAFARQQWQMTQEVNLMYVACTRAQETLVNVIIEKQEARDATA